MRTITQTSAYQAKKAPFEAFGMLYYPLFAHRSDLANVVLDDADMAWAVSANVNLEGTGYTLSQLSIAALAAYHHVAAELAASTSLLPVSQGLAACGINPLEDLQRLVPDVHATPMYPDFPQQVMEMDEALFRYHQACHYLSTYGVEQVAGLFGLDVQVAEGWLPPVETTPQTRADKTVVVPKVLHVVLTIEDLRAVVARRLARATRMHEAELASALLVFDGGEGKGGTDAFPHIAFHENMMALIRLAAQSDSATLERVASSLAQHPGDLLKAILYLVEASPRNHLRTRQKKGLCRAFEHFDALAIARNLADAGRKARLAPNFLSVARFGGPHLQEALELVASRQVRSWASELEQLWGVVCPPRQKRPVHYMTYEDYYRSKAEQARRLAEGPAGPTQEELQAWGALLSYYGTRPGVLFRSLGRLVKAGCPTDLLVAEVQGHADAYALPTVVRTLTKMSAQSGSYHMARGSDGRFSLARVDADGQTYAAHEQLRPLLRELMVAKLRMLDTPIRGRRVYVDTAGISLAGSLLMPNEVGDTGTAWPPVGMAWDLPEDKIVRFFTFWDDRSKRVDVDLHFVGRTLDGKNVHIGWDGDFRGSGLVSSGDMTTSVNSAEYLDADVAAARALGVDFVVQQQHIYCGASNWSDIATCFSGALIVRDNARGARLYNSQNLLFRDDLSGAGRSMSYAVVNIPDHYVRILRGANLPLGKVTFSLGDYLADLFQAQGAKQVDDPEQAEVRVCVGRSDDPAVLSLFDEGFFIG